MNGVAAGTAATPVPAPPAVGISVKSGFSWTLAGYFVYMACQWGMLVVLTREGAKADVGLFVMALAITTPIVLFSNLSLRRVFATDATSAFRFPDYFTLRIVTNFAGLAAIAGFVWIRGYRSELVWAALAMGAAKMIESTSDILHGYFQERRRIDLGARSTILRGVLSLAGFVAGFALTRQVFWAIIGMGAGWAAVLLLYDWPRAVRFLRQSQPRFSSPFERPSRAWLKLAKIALPLGLVALVISLKANIPVHVIEESMGTVAAGVFGAIIYFYHGSNRVVSALGEATATRLASLHASSDAPGVTRLMSRILGVSLFVSLAGLAGAIVLGEPLLRIFYGSEYAGLGPFLVAVMAAAFVANLQTVFDYAMMATRKLKIQPWLYGGSAALLLALCVKWVPSRGLSGAALALGIVSALELIVSCGLIGWELLGRKSTRVRVPAEGRP